MGPEGGRSSPTLRTLRRATPGLATPAAMGQAGPALVMTMALPVTPCGGSPHPTVLDLWVRPTGHCPAACGGDVSGTDEGAVAAKSIVRTAEGPAPALGDPAPAAGTGRRAPPLLHLHQRDAPQLGLVLQRPADMASPPA